MVAKLWKKVLFVILIIACLFNIVNKLVHKASLDEMCIRDRYKLLY